MAVPLVAGIPIFLVLVLVPLIVIIEEGFKCTAAEPGAFLRIECWDPWFVAMFFLLNLCSILGICFYAYLENSKATKIQEQAGDVGSEQAQYEQHFLGGKSFGTFMLIMTMFSTIYSGYTVVGVPNESSALGFFAFRWLALAVMVIFTFMLFYPRLRRFSVIRNYLAPSDPVTDRFNCKVVTLTVTLMMCISNLIYIIANFRALRGILLVLLGLDDAMTNFMVFWLGLIMWVCEISGGMRSVAFTDAIQSTIMICCMILLPIMVSNEWGTYVDVVPWDCKNGKYANGKVNADLNGEVGCLADVATSKGLLVLHPTVTGKSEFFKAYWEGYHITPTGLKSLSTCPSTVKRVPWKFDCNDGKKNGEETDVDCGGWCASNADLGCATGKVCKQNSDCKSSNCDSGICGTSSAPTPVPNATSAPTPVPNATSAPTPVPNATSAPTKACFWKEFKDGIWNGEKQRYDYAIVHELKGCNADWTGCTEVVYQKGFYTVNFADGASVALSAPFRHYDGSKYFNGSTFGMFSFMVLFFPFLLNPHWIQRCLAAKTDAVLKKTNTFMILSGLFATIPGLYMGIVHAAVLRDCFRSFDPTMPQNKNGCKYPFKSGSNVFGTFVQYFLLEGGFGAFVGGLAGTSSIAAIMSTADSAVIGCGNLITRDVVSGYLKPDMKTKELMNLSKVISFVLIMVGIVVPLYDKNVRENGIIYGFLIALQCAFLWQAMPAYYFALYGKSNNPTPIIGGMVVGIISLIALFGASQPLAENCGIMKSCYGTGYADAKDTEGRGKDQNAPGGYWVDAGTWAGLINFAVVLIMQTFVPTFDITNESWQYSKDRMAQFGTEALNQEKVSTILERTTEPLNMRKNPLGWVCGWGAPIVMVLGYPWYGTEQSGCTMETYGAWKNCQKASAVAAAAPAATAVAAAAAAVTACDASQLENHYGTCVPETFIGGMPAWAFGIHMAWGIAVGLLVVANLTWKVTDDVDASRGEGVKTSAVAPFTNK